ncbi:hypothetical protein OROHE_017128 [Orobanche hederae]
MQFQETRGIFKLNIAMQIEPKRCRFEESREVNPYDQYVISKRALRLKKQLLIDCTQEVQVMEKCRKEETKAVLGDGEIWKYIYEKLWIWSQDSITQNNVLHLLHSDMAALSLSSLLSPSAYLHFHPYVRE